MVRLFYGNFCCEHELADPTVPANPRMQRLAAELGAVWCTIGSAGDAIWLPGGGERDFVANLVESGLDQVEIIESQAGLSPDTELVPWGWSAAARSFGEGHGLVVDGPSVAAVRRVNARSFRWDLERALGVALPGACIVRSLDDVSTAIGGLENGRDRWVLKAEFGMSGRERFLGRGRSSTNEVAWWMHRRAGFGGFVFEPWVDRIEEVGLHFTIPEMAAGPPRFDGATPLLIDDSGHYRGSRFEADERLERDWADALVVASRVAERLADVGYRGPLGIDACRFRDEQGAVRVRPLQDLNARYTMGRLALGLRRLLQPGECGTWCHVRWPADGRTRMAELASRLGADVRLVRTSPFEVGGIAVAHGTLAIVGSREAVRRAEEVVLSMP